MLEEEPEDGHARYACLYEPSMLEMITMLAYYLLEPAEARHLSAIIILISSAFLASRRSDC